MLIADVTSDQVGLGALIDLDHDPGRVHRALTVAKRVESDSPGEAFGKAIVTDANFVVVITIVFTRI